jgi:chaperone required for assembly of F1-ATPase
MTRDPRTPDGKPGSPRIPDKDALRTLPRRFYKSAAVEEREQGFAVVLDGRTVRTPGKRELVVPAAGLAAALAAEWDAQGEHVDPGTMPLTRLVNASLDAVEQRKGEVAEDIVAFAGSDLLCYRAEAPDTLVRRQAEAWNPVLAWARRELGVELVLRAGLMPITQPPESMKAVRRALADLDALSLAALHVLTTISGSALLALAHWQGELTVDEAWTAATVDETWQREQWGHDAEAEAHAALRRAEFEAASLCLRCLRSPR